MAVAGRISYATVYVCHVRVRETSVLRVVASMHTAFDSYAVLVCSIRYALHCIMDIATI